MAQAPILTLLSALHAHVAMGLEAIALAIVLPLRVDFLEALRTATTHTASNVRLIYYDAANARRVANITTAIQV